ncbi:MAG: hypothetical protein MJ114_09230 [Acetatifactor sp.]|nr:hypothetical protein [Acetatifactor sp.]
MFFREDHTFRDIQEKSVEEWLSQMSDHEDICVRGGVKATREYIASLKKQLAVLEEKNALKDQYLRQMKEKRQ